uniref:Odorant receptor n=1 Tax=Athetis dissimilis TaxID=1737331 RepID=A0A0S1TPW8_ATHDI|nr:odorant receptor 40 [Athetis dissimilis]
MEVLKDFPEDFAKALQTSFYMLNLFNVRYLEDENTFFKKYWRFSYIGATVFIHVLTLGLHMSELVTEKEMNQFAYLIPSILVTIHAVLKSLLLIPETRQISEFIKELGSLWRVKFTSSQRKQKDALFWQLHLINRASFWATVCGSFQYLLSPLFETLFRRFILKQDCELLLPFATNYPFNPTKNWLIYLLVYIFQLYSMTVLVGIYMGAALMMTTSCALLGIEFLMLKEDLALVKPKPNRNWNFDEGTHDDNDDASIETFVERHQKLLRLSRQLDNVFNGMVFIDILFVGITTCAFSFMGQFARGPGMLVSYIGIASSMLTVLYLCYYGELLTGASSSIGDTAYNNLWYKGGSHYKSAILFIIKISQKPCCLTSLRYAVVSMAMFTKVISTTWSYFSLMNSVYSEE